MSNTPEGKVKQKVRDLLKKHGIHYLHIPGSQFGKGGAPDYVACVCGFFLAIECKAAGGRQTELQKIEETKIGAAKGVYILVWETNLGELESRILEMKSTYALAASVLAQ